ncbi:phosphotransferase [Buchananella hordeovulneris]|uniref:Aminoglycoside phosphotransferase domain-containing protein n=1 Tax=Buchananella hordeovulneris TaxID=52770 RepID=A0A1Q5PVN8_9ACTO|nr:phosphotransferase [Buchananella hordeovulneris]MDO5080709.1 phosphotransferase [Buchananella hordeovulneris]OKL51651.1 hypothetical protein BSZ40_05700 [Buchananella hordeovulneris]RRD42357.1 hypothetical protein EII13_09785 [Buchananella hordeovulneris]RRD50851.1 hypothetical protein EII12_09020 [Buchananella hordeovulneris]
MHNPTAPKLAALAVGLLPSFAATDYLAIPTEDGYQEVYVRGENGRIVRVVHAHQPTTAAELLRAARAAVALCDLGPRYLPFKVARPLASSADADSLTVIYGTVPGVPLESSHLEVSDLLNRSLGETLAALHNINPTHLADAQLPTRSPQQVRQAHRAELQEAVASGKVPQVLQDRWTSQFDNVALWKFNPTLVHGNLSPSEVRVEEESITALDDLTKMHIGDPATDLAWYVGEADEVTQNIFFTAYGERLSGPMDSHLTERALLYAELELVRWLLHGLRTGSAEVIADAEGLLGELAAPFLVSEAHTTQLSLAELQAHPEDAAALPAGEAPPDDDATAKFDTAAYARRRVQAQAEVVGILDTKATDSVPDTQRLGDLPAS